MLTEAEMTLIQERNQLNDELYRVNYCLKQAHKLVTEKQIELDKSVASNSLILQRVDELERLLWKDKLCIICGRHTVKSSKGYYEKTCTTKNCFKQKKQFRGAITPYTIS